MKPMKKTLALLLALSLCLSMAACADSRGQNSQAPSDPASEPPVSQPASEQPGEDGGELAAAEIQVFIAASLENAFQDIIALYRDSQPNITVTYSADSSGTLLTQIQEGFECDIFFSAGARQINDLEADGLAIEGTRVDLLQNKVALITYKGSGTSVTALSEIGNAASVALAGSSVPVGQYTRTALQALGILDSGKDAAEFTAQEVSEALGGVEINETANVSATLNAVAEGSNEVGTVYYSDAYSRIDDVEILELVDSSLTGSIVYPMSRVVNAGADQAQTAAADDFYAFLQTDAVMDIFESYLFVSNLEG